MEIPHSTAPSEQPSVASTSSSRDNGGGAIGPRSPHHTSPRTHHHDPALSHTSNNKHSSNGKSSHRHGQHRHSKTSPSTVPLATTSSPASSPPITPIPPPPNDTPASSQSKNNMKVMLPQLPDLQLEHERHLQQQQHHKFIYSSLTRMSDLDPLQPTARPFDVHKISNSLVAPRWEAGDYVVARYINPTHHLAYSGPPTSAGDFIELPTGRHRFLLPGDIVVGALGRRQATQELCGDFSLVETLDHPSRTIIEDINGAGLFGRVTSVSSRVAQHAQFVYEGHVCRDRHKVSMRDFVALDQDVPPVPYPPSSLQQRPVPTVLIIGTSMSSGKSCTARVVIRTLKDMSSNGGSVEVHDHDDDRSSSNNNNKALRVVAAKLTGAGYLNDPLGFHDAGADAVVDFVQVGLPTTVTAESEYEQGLNKMYGLILHHRPDVVVLEVGASPIENYNGRSVLESFTRKPPTQDEDPGDYHQHDGTNSLKEGKVNDYTPTNDPNLFVILCANDAYAVLGAKQYLRRFELVPDLVTGQCANTKAGQDLVASLTGIVASSLNDDKSVKEFTDLLKDRLNLFDRNSEDCGDLNITGTTPEVETPVADVTHEGTIATHNPKDPGTEDSDILEQRVLSSRMHHLRW